MKTYNCLVALGTNTGNVNPHHEVPKFSVTRAEVVILRAIHGKDAVKNLVPVGETLPDVTDMDVYKYLAIFYPVRLIERLFNVVLVDLDSDLDDEGLEEGLDTETPNTIVGGRPLAAGPGDDENDGDDAAISGGAAVLSSRQPVTVRDALD